MTTIKLVMEMENGDNVPGTDDEVVAAQTATEVESSTSELAEAGGEVETYSDAIDTSISASDELGEVAEKLEAGVESGEGVSAETAEMAEIAVESICAKVGISARESRVMPTMESFGSSNSRLAATKLALEGVKETAVRIWEAIKKAVIHVWNVIKSFFAGLTKSRSMMEKHLKNLKERATKAEGAPKEKKISTGAKAFSIKGKASAANVHQVLKDSTLLIKMGAESAKLIGNNTQATLNSKSKMADAFEVFTKLAENLDAAKGGKGKAYGQLVNGRSIVVDLDKKDKNALPTIGVETVEKNFAKEIDAPTKSEILAVVDSAEAALKALVEYDKISSQLESVSKTLTATADEVLKQGASAKAAVGDTDGSDSATKMQESVRSANKLLSKLGASIPSLTFSAVKAAADYANAGINNLSKKEK